MNAKRNIVTEIEGKRGRVSHSFREMIRGIQRTFCGEQQHPFQDKETLEKWQDGQDPYMAVIMDPCARNIHYYVDEGVGRIFGVGGLVGGYNKNSLSYIIEHGCRALSVVGDSHATIMTAVAEALTDPHNPEHEYLKPLIAETRAHLYKSIKSIADLENLAYEGARSLVMPYNKEISEVMDRIRDEKDHLVDVDTEDLQVLMGDKEIKKRIIDAANCELLYANVRSMENLLKDLRKKGKTDKYARVQAFFADRDTGVMMAVPARHRPDQALTPIHNMMAVLDKVRTRQSKTECHETPEIFKGNEEKLNKLPNNAAVISCGDSRKPTYFAGILGLLSYNIRNAGAVVKEIGLSVLQLLAKKKLIDAILVVDHTRCGAMTAAAKKAAQHLTSIHSELGPLADEFGGKIEKMTSVHARRTAKRIKRALPELPVYSTVYGTVSGILRTPRQAFMIPDKSKSTKRSPTNIGRFSQLD